jgi:Tol biopolymer transport system component
MYIEVDVYDNNENYITRRKIVNSSETFTLSGLQAETQYNVRARRNLNGLFSPYTISSFTTSPAFVIEERLIYNSNKSGQWQSYSIKPDGTGEINITNDGTKEDRYCTYSSTLDAYIFCRRVSSRLEIHKMDRVSRNVTQLTIGSTHDHVFPNISPDGSYICANLNGAVRILNASDGALLHSWTPTIGMNTTIEFATFNNANKVLVGSSAFPSYYLSLYNLDGSGASLLANESGATLGRFNSDFTKIIYRANFAGVDQVRTMNANGTSKSTITSGAGDKEYPTYSPDGLKFAFVQPAYQGNIYISTFAVPNTKTNLTNNANSNEFNGFWGNLLV